MRPSVTAGGATPKLPAVRLAEVLRLAAARRLAGALLLTGVWLHSGVWLLSGAPARAADGSRKPTIEEIIKRWEDGPVRYLMTTAEEAEVRTLKTPQELSRFITVFWARRDPTPGTVENELRSAYWERVIVANRKYRDSTTPGWKTDRGKVYILLGEPFQVEEDLSPKVPSDPRSGRTGDRDPGTRGIERWHYRRSASPGAAPEFVVAFVRDESLDWKLSSNPDLLAPDFPGTNTLDSRNTSFGGIESRSRSTINQASAGTGARTLPTIADEVAGAAPPPFDTSILSNYDLGLELSAPTASESVLAIVNARDFIGAFAATPRFEFFRAQDGSTFVNVGALAGFEDLYGEARTGVTELRVHASLVPSAEPGAPRYASNEKSPRALDLARGAEPGGLVDVWTGLALPPGRYEATLAVEDSLTGRLGRATGVVEVPDFRSSRLALSTLLLATSLSESGDRLGAQTRASGVFRKSEEFALYYEVYGLGAQSGGGSLFDASYRFSREASAGPVPLGKPIAMTDRTEGVQGWSFPLEKWPAGRYGIEVTVTDRVTGQTVSGRASFEVTD